ncbi:hypothetical protein Csa_023163 [Cucumis sativus]|uniref:Uncharacterized protein n=1 Tax=Cucumis sativus TaxID=3659 RepID=A0A0A0LYG7_CUCSA|nr:hypothetical protein Csa_023163 [Cucumis sativus]
MPSPLQEDDDGVAPPLPFQEDADQLRLCLSKKTTVQLYLCLFKMKMVQFCHFKMMAKQNGVERRCPIVPTKEVDLTKST